MAYIYNKGYDSHNLQATSMLTVKVWITSWFRMSRSLPPSSLYYIMYLLTVPALRDSEHMSQLAGLRCLADGRWLTVHFI